MAKPKNRATTQAQDAQIIVGIKKDLSSVTQLPLGGVTYTPTSLEAFFQSRIDAGNQVATTRATWLAAVASYDALITKGLPVVSGLKQLVMGLFGKTAPQLADFGYTPPKPATRTPAQKTESAEKAAATRKARGTMGPKAKLAVTGETVKNAAASPAPAVAPAPTPAPVPAPATPAPAPQPAPAPGATPAPGTPKS